MPRLQNLLGQAGGVPEQAPDPPRDEARDEHPDASWRADALGQSRHARLAELLRQPLDDSDPERAWAVLAEVTRNAMVDLSPSLILVTPAERRRCQALVALAQMVFDFARQTGVEGERLAALNRIRFTLEQSLSGEPVGQPVYVAMAAEEERRPWDRDALDALFDGATEQATRGRPRTAAELERRAERMARAVVAALVGGEAEAAVVSGGAAILRVRALLDLGDSLRRGIAALPVEELPSPGDPERALDREVVEAAVAAESRRLRPLLEAARREASSLPRSFSRGLEYLLLAALALLGEVERAGWRVVDDPPRLGLWRRLWLLAKARL